MGGQSHLQNALSWAASPRNSSKGHPGPGGGFAPLASCGAPRGGGGRILTPALRRCGFALVDSVQGGCQCPSKHPPRSPHPSASGTQSPLSCWGGRGAAPKSLWQQRGHDMSQGSVGC